MKLDQMLRARPEFAHRIDCPCPACRPPAPSDPRRAILVRLQYRAPALFAAGMATGAITVAATGHLGAALRALVGL